MPLEKIDISRLKDWGFLSDIENNKEKWIDLARSTYKEIRKILSFNPTYVIDADDCVKLFQVVLLRTDLFKGILYRKKHLWPKYHAIISLAFAKYVLHTYWDEIASQEE